jgi:chemotaxis methyl-accepting protein methylase
VSSESRVGWRAERVDAAALALASAHDIARPLFWDAVAREPRLASDLAHAVRAGRWRFYRDPAQWEALRRQVLAPHGLVHKRQFSALSVGCSSGEEAWTIAMLLWHAAPELGAAGRLCVLGVDINAAALATARRATYDRDGARLVPRELGQRFLQPAVDGAVRIVPRLQACVEFARCDATRGLPGRSFDFIVCRHVLSSLAADARRRLSRALLSSLAPDATLLVARDEVAELVASGAEPFELAPGIVALRGAPC